MNLSIHFDLTAVQTRVLYALINAIDNQTAKLRADREEVVAELVRRRGQGQLDL